MPKTVEREKTSDVYLTIRVSSELRDALNALAALNYRTQAAEVRLALHKHLADSPTR